MREHWQTISGQIGLDYSENIEAIFDMPTVMDILSRENPNSGGDIQKAKEFLNNPFFRPFLEKRFPCVLTGKIGKYDAAIIPAAGTHSSSSALFTSVNSGVPSIIFAFTPKSETLESGYLTNNCLTASISFGLSTNEVTCSRLDFAFTAISLLNSMSCERIFPARNSLPKKVFFLIDIPKSYLRGKTR